MTNDITRHLADSPLPFRQPHYSAHPHSPTTHVVLIEPRLWTRAILARALGSSAHDIKVLPFDRAANLAGQSFPSTRTLVLLSDGGASPCDATIWTEIATARSHIRDIPIILLASSIDAPEILTAIRRGLHGYIPMSMGIGPAIEALLYVPAGGVFAPVEALLEGLGPAGGTPVEPAPRQGSTGAAELGIRPISSAAPDTPLALLTPREHAVLECLRHGKSNKLIARELTMMEATVKVHVRHIMRKLGAANRTQVALVADKLLRAVGTGDNAGTV